MIGILGGTFDPIHLGHLRVALDIKEALDLNEIRFIPLHTAVHRAQPNATREQRLHMVQLAVRDQPGFVVDERELHRQQPSYSLHTLQSLRNEFPTETFYLLIGSDAYQHFLSWHEPEQILELAHLVVMQRPGFQLSGSRELETLTTRHRVSDLDLLHARSSGGIYFQDVTQLNISSTDIRRRIAEGRSARYLLPAKIEQYLREEKLYLNA